jgi:ribonuclease HI
VAQKPDKKAVTLYTDGACTGNPGPGGYGVILQFGKHRRELSGGYAHTTNNRMEMMAVIAGLQALKEPCRVRVVTDSEYVVNAMEKGWARSWKARGWRRRTGEPALNADLWERILDLCQEHQVSFQWVRGHAGHAENERCDRLAVEAAARPDLPRDVRGRSAES